MSNSTNKTKDKADLKYNCLFNVLTALIIDITPRNALRNMNISKGIILVIPEVLATEFIIQITIEQTIKVSGTIKICLLIVHEKRC